MAESPFLIGAPVAIFSGRGWGESVRIDHVAKVYGNGNFVLAADRTRQQWRVYGNRACPTGDGYHKPEACVLTPDVRKRVQALHLAQRWRNAVAKLEKVDSRLPSEAMIVVLECVVADAEDAAKKKAGGEAA